jgi:hypothetical protein
MFTSSINETPEHALRADESDGKAAPLVCRGDQGDKTSDREVDVLHGFARLTEHVPKSKVNGLPAREHLSALRDGQGVEQ